MLHLGTMTQTEVIRQVLLRHGKGFAKCADLFASHCSFLLCTMVNTGGGNVNRPSSSPFRCLVFPLHFKYMLQVVRSQQDFGRFLGKFPSITESRPDSVSPSVRRNHQKGVG